MTLNPTFDALVVGGGPAGLSAGVALGRSRRRVLLAASGPTRNARAEAAHNVFTRDGTPPGELTRIGREQLAPYDVTVREARVEHVERGPTGFRATFDRGPDVLARRILLAIGVRDVLPEVPGFAELWGTGVFHCPYCHGWEVSGEPLALYGQGDKALHLVRLLRGWTDDLVLFTDGPSGLSTEERASIERSGVRIHEEPLERLVASGEHLAAVVLEDGERIERSGLFIAPQQELASDLPHRLGCPLTPHGRIQADAAGRTPVQGVFVAGDAGPGHQSVPTAAATGALAGAMLNHDLLEEEFDRQ